MKKVFGWLMCLVLALAVAAGACAESAETLFITLSVNEWSFSSGVGAWSTDIKILPDGSFFGTYHDSEMGETGDDYPDGTIYGCTFTGTMSLVEQVDDNTWKIRIDQLTPDEGQVPEAIDGGVRFVTTEIYGLSEGDEMLLYKPGTPVSVLSEDMQFWAHIQDWETPPTELQTWFLCSEKNESGFVGFEAPEPLV